MKTSVEFSADGERADIIAGDSDWTFYFQPEEVPSDIKERIIGEIVATILRKTDEEWATQVIYDLDKIVEVLSEHQDKFDDNYSREREEEAYNYLAHKRELEYQEREFRRMKGF